MCEDIEGTLEKFPHTKNSSCGDERERFASVSVSVEGNFGESCARSFAGSVMCEGVYVDEAFCSTGRDNFASAD